MPHLPAPDGGPVSPVIELEHFESDAVRWVVAQAEVELGVRYGFLADSEVALTAEMFGPPGGAFVVARLAGDVPPAGGVGLRRITSEVAEVKRLWVDPSLRRAGVGRALMAALERTAADMGYRSLRLETGNRQPEAVALYAANGWMRQHEGWGGGGCIPDYSVRFAKDLA